MEGEPCRERGLAPVILHIQLPASLQQSNFSDTFLEQLSLSCISIQILPLALLTSSWCLVFPLRGCHTLSGDFQPDLAAQQPGQRSSPETLSEAALGSSSKPQTISNIPRPEQHTVGIRWELDPRGIPGHRYAAQRESVPPHLACGQHRRAYLLHFIMRKWWARSPKAFRCFDI